MTEVLAKKVRTKKIVSDMESPTVAKKATVASRPRASRAKKPVIVARKLVAPMVARALLSSVSVRSVLMVNFQHPNQSLARKAT
jgi:hypothetical protein